jgi:tetratricopeptide (TPR) repeat protein
LSQVHGTAAENAEASYWLEKAYQSLGAETYARLEETYPDSWHTHQLRAEGSALRGNWDSAFEEFKVALAQHPDEPELHEAVGELYLDTSDLDSAERELEKALAIDRMRTHALYLLGRVCVLKKENEKAVPYLEQALQLEPDLSEANSLLGTAYLRLGQLEKAVAKLEKAAPSDHYGNVHYQLGVAYRKLGQPERAKKEMLLWQDVRRNSAERDQALVMGSAPPLAIDGMDVK